MRFSFRHLRPAIFIRVLRSLFYSHKVSEATRVLPIRVGNPFLKIHIHKSPGASFVVRGVLSIHSYQGGDERVLITLGRNSRLVIDGDFMIGNGVKIMLSEGASLYIGGRRHESASGITERTRIMVRKKMEIGYDCIIAWNVFITDCEWHTIEGRPCQRDVFIGNHVWIAANTSILKGSKIGNGSIVAAHTLIKGETIPQNFIAGGNPVKIVRTNVIWHRDMMTEKDDKALNMNLNNHGPENVDRCIGLHNQKSVE